MNWTIFLFTLFVSISGIAAGDDQVPMVGLDSGGVPVELFVGKKVLQEHLSKAINSVQQSSFQFLESRSTGKAWSLRTIVVGISADVQAGIAGIITLDVVPRFRVLFSNNQDPAIP